MIKVVNKRYHKPTNNDIPIHRGFILGNPWTSKLSKTKAQYQCVTDIEAIANFREYLLEKLKSKDIDICSEMNRIYKMAKYGDVNLVCYCVPKCCHGDVIKEIIESKL